jgi:hypothetical protein
MNLFGPAAALGLIFGFMWGIGCALAILYSIYLGGYRKAISDSMEQPPPERYTKAVERIQAKRQKNAAHH